MRSRPHVPYRLYEKKGGGWSSLTLPLRANIRGNKPAENLQFVPL